MPETFLRVFSDGLEIPALSSILPSLQDLIQGLTDSIPPLKLPVPVESSQVVDNS